MITAGLAREGLCLLYSHQLVSGDLISVRQEGWPSRKARLDLGSILLAERTMKGSLCPLSSLEVRPIYRAISGEVIDSSL